VDQQFASKKRNSISALALNRISHFRETTGLFPPLRGLSPKPFIDCLAHRLFCPIFGPSDKGAVKFKVVAAFGFEEASDCLSISVRFGNRRCTRDLAAMPIER
jgi:hypothetical protein